MVMEDAAKSMPAEIAHDGAALSFGESLDRIADIAEMGTRPHHGNAAHQAFVSHLH